MAATITLRRREPRHGAGSDRDRGSAVAPLGARRIYSSRRSAASPKSDARPADGHVSGSFSCMNGSARGRTGHGQAAHRCRMVSRGEPQRRRPG